MPGRIIGAFFLCLIVIPIAQILADRELGIRRLEIWDGHLDLHQVAASKQHKASAPNPHDPSLHDPALPDPTLHLHRMRT